VRNEQDLVVLKSEARLEELLMHRLLVVAAEEVIQKAGTELLATLGERSRMLEVHTWGCFMNDARLTNRAAKQMLLQMRPSADGVRTHYARVSALHLGSCPHFGKDAQEELMQLLNMESCILRLLDLSNTPIDGAKLSEALAKNSSLQSLDVRWVPKMEESYEGIGDILLQPDSMSSLGYMRCDAFEVLEGETNLSVRERPLARGAMRLMTGLLKNNRDVQELDLSATCQRKEWALALMKTFAANPTVVSMHLPYNPLIDESAQAALVGDVEERGLKISLHF